MIEAISGFKDFEYETGSSNSKDILSKINSGSLLKAESLKLFDKNKQLLEETLNEPKQLRKMSVKSDNCVFDMDNMISQTDLNSVYELDETNSESNSKENEFMFEASPVSYKSKSPSAPKLGSSLKASLAQSNLPENSDQKYSPISSDLISRKYTLASQKDANGDSSTLENEKESSSDAFLINKQTNISSTAYNSFVRIIGSLGPVLTCKYCCNDLLKMLAICYMNSKCLSLIETAGTHLKTKIYYFLFNKN